MAKAQSVVYLIHLHSPIGHARHYVGWSNWLTRRLEHHRAGRGSRLLQVANQLGITYEVVRTWNADRSFERLLKNRKNAPRYCPICRKNH